MQAQDLRSAIAHRGISRFSDAQLRIMVRCGACHRAGQRPDPLASPRNDGVLLTPAPSKTGILSFLESELTMLRWTVPLIAAVAVAGTAASAADGPIVIKRGAYRAAS